MVEIEWTIDNDGSAGTLTRRPLVLLLPPPATHTLPGAGVLILERICRMSLRAIGCPRHRYTPAGGHIRLSAEA